MANRREELGTRQAFHEVIAWEWTKKKNQASQKGDKDSAHRYGQIARRHGEAAKIIRIYLGKSQK